MPEIHGWFVITANNRGGTGTTREIYAMRAGALGRSWCHNGAMTTAATEKPLIIFDVGGTLIDDPFPHAMRALEREDVGLSPDERRRLCDLWREENGGRDHPFASHFLQEEVWPASALLRLHAERGVPRREELPLLSVRLLARYREHARQAIRRQPSLPELRDVLERLASDGAQVGAASNDRELATSAMLGWAGLATTMSFILTSEGLSHTYPGAEKPAAAFFQAVLAEVPGPWRPIVYVGDSESNDIIPARACGFVTVRRIVRTDAPAVWLDGTTETTADYSYESAGELLELLRASMRM